MSINKEKLVENITSRINTNKRAIETKQKSFDMQAVKQLKEKQILLEDIMDDIQSGELDEEETHALEEKEVHYVAHRRESSTIITKTKTLQSSQ